MRVLVVDDSSFMRRAIATMLNADPDIEVIATACNGREAVALANQHKPDVITLDIEMPEMDGLTALRHIMRECPTQVLMVSSLTTEGSEASLKALRLGAADVVAKDHSAFSLQVIRNLQDVLRNRVKALGRSRRFRFRDPQQAATQTPAITPRPPKLHWSPSDFDLICIGSSTGGPPVLETLLEDLPKDMRQTVVIAQHMPEVFTRSMAKRLDNITGPDVFHAEQGMTLEPGKIYIATGGMHAHLRNMGTRLTIDINQEPVADLYKPSVSALFESAAKTRMAQRCLGIVLTGIGDDGLRGAHTLKQAGGKLIAQDEASCVVYGMPKAVTKANLVDASMSPAQIHQLLLSLTQSHSAAA